MDSNNKAKVFMVFGILTLIVAITITSTYAWYVWTTSESDTIKIVTGVGTAKVIFDGGSDISANLRPVSDKSKGIVKNISIKADTTDLTFNLYLDINSLDEDLKESSFKYALYQGDTEITSGNFATYTTEECKTNSTNHIVLLSNQSISTTTTTYTLYIWIDGVNEVNPSTMMNKTFSFNLHADGEGAVVEEPTLASTITDLYTNASKTTVTNNSITYNYANIYDTDSDENTSGGLMNDRLGGTTTDYDGGNIRYYGANPNNYIYFNCSDYSNQNDTTCEKWRIIGVFNGKVKLIRNSNIGTYSWDNKNTSTGSESAYGKNDWTTARLMKLLNPSDYYTIDPNDNGYGQSLYYNGQSGTCFSGYNNAKTTCDFTSTGLKNDTTRNMISEETYYLRENDNNSNSVYSDNAYKSERTTGSVYANNPTSWNGKIALAYPSDYGYAVDFNQCTQTLGYYDNNTCTSNNWMKSILETANGVWLLTPSSSYGAWYVTTSSRAYHFAATGYNREIFPVLHLDFAIEMSDVGDGSSSNPYRLSI